MDAHDFVKALAMAAPSAESLQDSDPAYVERYLASFVAAPRLQDLKAEAPPGLIGDLYRKYDVSNVEIGMITFLAQPFAAKEGWAIAKYEDDPFIVDPGTGEVLLYDHEVVGRLLYPCALNEARFLDALALWLTATIESDADALAQECAELAGGVRYLSLYLDLLGAE
jgi:hypothetical protein